MRYPALVRSSKTHESLTLPLKTSTQSRQLCLPATQTALNFFAALAQVRVARGRLFEAVLRKTVAASPIDQDALLKASRLIGLAATMKGRYGDRHFFGP